MAYPTLAEADRLWLEAVRLRHDRQASKIALHFTLVFPFELAEDSAAPHAQRVLGRLKPIPFVIRSAVAMPDPVGGGSHVFLVPDEGRAELEMLHARLYGGVMAPFLRHDIPFVPHLTVGAFERRDAGEELAAALNRDGLCVRGTVPRAHLVEVGEQSVRTVAEFPA